MPDDTENVAAYSNPSEPVDVDSHDTGADVAAEVGDATEASADADSETPKSDESDVAEPELEKKPVAQTESGKKSGGKKNGKAPDTPTGSATPSVVKKTDLPDGYETSEAARLRMLKEKAAKKAARQ